MATDERPLRWVDLPNGTKEHANKAVIDQALPSMNPDLRTVYPHIPTPRNDEGKFQADIREDIMASPSMQFHQLITRIADQFSELVKILGRLKF